ncbi:hypothetical protein ACWCP6_14320 [Streptomyces sp. NPDC002004]
MAVDQLPDQIGEFAVYLGELMARLDQADGWCGVFWQRDPDGMRACLDAREVPPWDVVEALLQDLAAERGAAVAARERGRARALHSAALTAYDARPGGRNVLGDRLDVMLREQRYAAERQTELARLLAVAATPKEAETIRLDLAWARDDQDRATARCTEIRHRMAELDRRERYGRDGPGRWDATAGPTAATSPAPQGAGQPGTGSPASPHAFADPGPEGGAGHTGPGDDPPRPGPQDEPARRRPKRRPRGARFAGIEDDGGAAVVPELPGADAAPGAPVPDEAPRGARFAAAASGDAPRGARFGGARRSRSRGGRPAEDVQRPDPDARQAVGDLVSDLVRLRAEGRSGEAHGLLVEAVHWPAPRFPLLAAELRDAGLGADWAALLWEAASLPVGRLVGAADALGAAGRGADGAQVLRQGVARPAQEIGDGLLGLLDEGREREVRILLDAYVRVRTPEEAARSAHSDPDRLIPLLLEAATGVSDERHWDMVHALRVNGLHP